MAIGNSFHRMGPSFERSRFGFPLMLLGLTCLILFPEDLADRESELHTSILRSIALIVPFSIGAILIIAKTDGRYARYAALYCNQGIRPSFLVGS